MKYASLSLVSVVFLLGPADDVNGSSVHIYVLTDDHASSTTSSDTPRANESHSAIRTSRISPTPEDRTTGSATGKAGQGQAAVSNGSGSFLSGPSAGGSAGNSLGSVFDGSEPLFAGGIEPDVSEDFEINGSNGMGSPELSAVDFSATGEVGPPEREHFGLAELDGSDPPGSQSLAPLPVRRFNPPGRPDGLPSNGAGGETTGGVIPNPEPASFILFALGISGLALIGFSRTRKAKNPAN